MESVRDARLDDAAALTAMVHTSAAYGGVYRPVVLELAVDAAYLADAHTRVAESAGVVVGFHSLLVPGRGADGEGELDYLFVADDHQGLGVGRTLIQDVRQLAAGLGVTRVHIVSHPPAEAFYRRVGARRIGEVPPAGRVTWTRPLLVLPI